MEHIDRLGDHDSRRSQQRRRAKALVSSCDRGANSARKHRIRYFCTLGALQILQVPHHASSRILESYDRHRFHIGHYPRLRYVRHPALSPALLPSRAGLVAIPIWHPSHAHHARDCCPRCNQRPPSLILGRYKPIHIVGFALITLGTSLCTLLNANTPMVGWTFFQLIAASDSGIDVLSILPTVQVSLPGSTRGSSAGSWAFSRRTGSLFGVAVPGAIFNVRFAQLLPTISSEAARRELENGQAYPRATVKFTQKFGDGFKVQVVNAFTQALASTWIVFAVFSVVGFVC